MSRTGLSPAQLSLERTQILVVDGDVLGTEIIGQVLRGFGARTIDKVSTVAAAQMLLKQAKFDMILVDPAALELDGYDFVGWLRRQADLPSRFCPVMIVSGHTKRSRIRAARDCGANFVVAKPIAPRILLDRMMWMANESRPFIACDSYVGPDRRFKDDGPPGGGLGRRRGDRPSAPPADPLAAEAHLLLHPGELAP